MDTTTKGPLPPDSRLWDLPSVLITPHLTPVVSDRIGWSLDIILDNIERYKTGQPLQNQLTLEDVYSK